MTEHGNLYVASRKMKALVPVCRTIEIPSRQLPVEQDGQIANTIAATGSITTASRTT